VPCTPHLLTGHLQVFERGLKAIPLSVDLWLHFLNHCKTTNPGDDDFIRSQFERALDICGMEFRYEPRSLFKYGCIFRA
jgi:hypothetical protein